MGSKRRGKDAVILLSGGIDSAIAAAWAKRRGRRLHGLAVDYGQRHGKKELAASRRLATALGFQSYHKLRVPLNAVAKGSLVDGGSIRQSGVKPGKPSTYVSFRNGVLLSLAAAAADSLNAAEIWGGWCLADRGGYPDCRPAFLRAMQQAARLGTARPGLKVVAPLAALSKAAALAKAVRWKLPLKLTWTCYLGRAKPCRRCDACRLREDAFKRAGMKDPLLR